MASIQLLDEREGGSSSGRGVWERRQTSDTLGPMQAAPILALLTLRTSAARWSNGLGGPFRTVSVIAVALAGFLHSSDLLAEGGSPFAAPPTLNAAPPAARAGGWPSPRPAPAEPSAEDARYAKLCDAFGEGFVYSPGTGVCIRIGGYVKFGTQFGRRN